MINIKNKLKDIPNTIFGARILSEREWQGTRRVMALLSLLFLFTPTFTSALVTGGGYQMHEQVTAINDTSTGNGYILRHSGNTVQGLSWGNGFVLLNGGNPAFAALTPVVVPVTPTPSGSGGGGGGSIVVQTATTTSINNMYLNQTGDQNQKIDFSNDFRADIDDSGKIDILDFNMLIVNWAKRQSVDLRLTKKDRCQQVNLADVNCDGFVNVLDFNLVLVYWGQYIGNEGVALKRKIK